MRTWKKLKKTNLSAAEKLLREREEFCVSAISRFNTETTDHVWAFGAKAEGTASALLLYGKRLLFPVFNFSAAQLDTFQNNGMPLPLMFSMLLKRDSLHAAQGLADDMDLLEKALREKNFFPATTNDYELLSLVYSTRMQNGAANKSLHSSKSPPGLLVRKAEMSDADALFPLQAGYETEEVLPPGAKFNPASCRKIVESLILGGLIMTAELGGSLVGKININACSYNRFQIGGVYVQPEYRNMGIARAMTSSLIREYAPVKNYFTLFVKKKNIPARRVYDSLGFKRIADYRITYFE
jgi:ribosomal protein S18 acetylase RimI-like enzyme